MTHDLGLLLANPALQIAGIVVVYLLVFTRHSH
jgi:hypothetical protein